MGRERAINRSRQGAIGEASAIEWLTSRGALVWVPLGPSPHVDLIAESDGRLLRVQVKTSTFKRLTGRGEERWEVSIRTRGGNRSWSGSNKRFDPAATDRLFVITGDGRRWYIPSEAVEGTAVILLGGAKYSEFEVDRGTALEAAVYRGENQIKIGDSVALGECQSGQMDVTVNHAAMPTEVRILSPPSPDLGARD